MHRWRNTPASWNGCGLLTEKLSAGWHFLALVFDEHMAVYVDGMKESLTHMHEPFQMITNHQHNTTHLHIAVSINTRHYT